MENKTSVWKWLKNTDGTIVHAGTHIKHKHSRNVYCMSLFTHKTYTQHTSAETITLDQPCWNKPKIMHCFQKHFKNIPSINPLQTLPRSSNKINLFCQNEPLYAVCWHVVVSWIHFDLRVSHSPLHFVFTASGRSNPERHSKRTKWLRETDFALVL